MDPAPDPTALRRAWSSPAAPPCGSTAPTRPRSSYAGRTLLERALDALLDAAEVVVVGEPVPTSRPVTFTRESPRVRRPGRRAC